MPGDFYRTGNTTRGRVGSMEMAPPRADKREQARSAINDMQRPFLDIERGLSHGFA